MSSTTPTSLASSLNEVYPVFEPNQLLTSNHLNQLRNYLDTQDRLSRVKLIGIGILCGLDVSFETNRIKISKGTGITSEGFLINMEEEIFSRCSSVNYTDSQAYPPFLATESTQIPMWELVPDTVSANVNLFASPTPVNFLQNKVVVLFMEYKDIDLETCLTQNCDQKGINREFKIRKLLIQCTDVDKIIRDGYGILPPTTLNDAFNKRFTPAYAAMRSFTILPSDSLPPSWNSYLLGIDTSQDLIDRYKAIYPDDETNPLYTLADKINEAYSTYEPLLKGIVILSDVTLIRATLTSYFNLVKNTSAIQYYYQFSKDVIYAYNEFIDLAFELVAECSPNETRFPRHLVLGKVKEDGICPENTQACRPSLYRTHFVQTPIYNSQKEKLAETRNSFKRLMEMISKFNPAIALDAPLKITPSKEKSSELGDRSIPFYYNPATELYKVWNFNFAKKCKSQWNLGYWSSQFLPLIPSSQVPLEFDMDPYNFFRIESVLGKPYKDVALELTHLKRKHQLDFEILPLKLRLSATSPKNQGCSLASLQDDYLQLRNEILIDLKRFDEYYQKINYFIANVVQLIKSKADLKVIDVRAITEGKKIDIDVNRMSDRMLKVIKTLPVCIDDYDPMRFLESFRLINEATLRTIIEVEKLLRYVKDKVIGFEFILNRILISSGFFETIYGLNQQLMNTKDLQLSMIYFSYFNRLNDLQSQTLFSRFAIRNSGLTPLAGVPKGGTYILVYDKDGENEQVVADFAINGRVACQDQTPICDKSNEDMPIVTRDIYVFVESDHDFGEPIYIDVAKHVVDFSGESRTPFVSGVEVEVKSHYKAEVFIVKDRDDESAIIGYKVSGKILDLFKEKAAYDDKDYYPADKIVSKEEEIVSKDKEVVSESDEIRKKAALNAFEEFIVLEEKSESRVLNQFKEFVKSDKSKDGDILQKLDDFTEKDLDNKIEILQQFEAYYNVDKGDKFDKIKAGEDDKSILYDKLTEIIESRSDETISEKDPKIISESSKELDEKLVRDKLADRKEIVTEVISDKGEVKADEKDPDLMPYDVFDYEIISKDRVASRALVYIILLPAFSIADFLTSLCCGNRKVIVEDPDPVRGGGKEDVPVIPDKGDGKEVVDEVKEDPTIDVIKDGGKKDGPVIPDKGDGKEVIDEVKEDPIIDVIKDGGKKDGPVIPDKGDGKEVVDEVKGDPTIDVIKGEGKKDGTVILGEDVIKGGGKEDIPVIPDADGGKEVVVDEKEVPIIDVVEGGGKDPFADFVRDFDHKNGDLVARENKVVKTYGTVLTTTSEEILKLDNEIGVPPENRTAFALFLKENKDKLAKRDGLVASFEKDLEDFLNIVGKDKLGTNTKGEVSSFIDKDLKIIYKNVAHLLVNFDTIVTGFTERDDVGLPVKVLVNGLKS